MGRRSWTVFAAMCALQASTWLLPRSEAAGAPVLARMGVACGLVALVAFLSKRERSSISTKKSVAVASLLLFAFPAFLITLATEYTSETTVAVVFAFTPVITALVWGAVATGRRSMEALVPALLAAGGVLLVLPFQLPNSVRSWQAFAIAIVAMVLTAAGGVWLHVGTRGRGGWGTLSVAGLINAAVLLGLCVGRGRFDLRSWDWMVWLDVIAWAGLFAATVWLAEEMEPIGFAARYLAVPLLTILEGVVLLRPEITGRLVVGFGLLACGAAWLLFKAGRAVDEEVLSLR
jgi:drug/metabolite transporter (DMT)-like permease